MSKAVLVSINPKWCELIANGKKTIEVRKTRPKLKTPFKCYIYMTKGFASYKTKNGLICHNNGGMVVIGEFVCDSVLDIRISCSDPNMKGYPFPGTGLTDREIMDYLGNGKTGYGWHISDLVIYNNAHKLNELSAVCKYKNDDGTCPTNKVACFYQQIDYNQDGSINLVECGKKIERPPQSWCYVDGLEG